MAADISLSCSTAPGVDRGAADVVCAEFLAFLDESQPGRGFVAGDQGQPRIDLKITSANERSLGFEIAWVAADGQVTQGTPLHRAFYDRNADPELRRRFYQKFLETNPLPF